MQRYRDYSILEACARLHEHCAGTGEFLTRAEFDDLVTWLEHRDETWGVGPYTPEYDHAVRMLLVETVREARRLGERMPFREPDEVLNQKLWVPGWRHES